MRKGELLELVACGAALLVTQNVDVLLVFSVMPFKID